MANRLCALPLELQVEILTNLDAISLIRCAMTCTAMYELFKSSSALAYTIQLYLNGLKDAGTSLSHSVLIESLVRRRQAWLALDVKEPLIRAQFNFEGYEIAGGAFAHISSDYFEISWLPTARNANGRTHRTPLIGISPDEFTMDPTQDLVVFLEDIRNETTNTRVIRIHIRTISTNTIHPQAQQSPLECTVYDHETNIDFPVLQIAYDIVSVHFRNFELETQAMVWDWTTSDLILDTSTSFDPCLPSLAYEFRLLDSRYFFIAPEGICGTIRLYKFVRSHATATQATRLAILHLPPTLPGITVSEIFCEAGAIEADPLPHTPFTVHDDHRLHMFTVHYRGETEQGFHGQAVHFFLLQRVLHKYARRACAARAPLDIPWAEWGPPDTLSTLTFPRRGICYWKRYIYGQRAVFIKHSVGTGTTSESSRTAEVFDFSLAAVLSAQGSLDTRSASPRGQPGKLLPASAIRTEDVPLFLDDVETHLPCVISTLHLTESCSACMIYADGIIGVNTSPDGNSYALNIYFI